MAVVHYTGVVAPSGIALSGPSPAVELCAPGSVAIGGDRSNLNPPVSFQCYVMSRRR